MSALLTAYCFGINAFENEAFVKANDKLKALLKTFDLPVSRLSFSMSFGMPQEEVLQMAEKINADLVLIDIFSTRKRLP
ncbi:hypothetical protein [Brenneria rubrifaciens]|uniref:hypothetical protein n=1 Tax=Brenneria rubrifaciens TaxID=55213 RepID=UPI00361F14EC